MEGWNYGAGEKSQNEQEIIIAWEVHIMEFHVDTNNKNLMMRLEREEFKSQNNSFSVLQDI